ncbi:MAG TPA: MBOAT family O-acyltransferase [Candidatus Eisenbacteria bacterium]|nr:MBOAT family O-acyltransferase [Candidatus Eisenbacteria bacterium]
MVFNTFEYFILILLPAAILFRLAKPAAKPWICVGFGVAFFIFFSVTQVGGWAGACCLGIFIWESIFSRFYKQGSKICIIGIIQTLLFLFVFKYWNFLTGLVFAPFGHNPAHWSGAFLPLGISFFTFEFIHYAVDRYRGKTEAGSFAEYLTFILFFPTMVAGPIKRYQDFRPKLLNPSRAWSKDWQQGITRILSGLAKKFAVADLLTAFTDHLNRADIAQAQRWVLPVWLLAFGFKIYFDFSAYSDIAIGSARLFGIKVPENFDWPYLRTNIAEFWKHWHISLYRWLVDYVFVPLGGSRVAQPRVYLNVLITMFLSGLWHGAGLNFVVWGVWHGMLLVIHRMWKNWRASPALRTNQQFGNWWWRLRGFRVQGVAPAPVAIGAEPLLATAGTINPMLGMAAGSISQPANRGSGGTEEILSAKTTPRTGSLTGKLVSWALTFTMVNLGWAFFCMDLPTALFFLRRLFFG